MRAFALAAIIAFFAPTQAAAPVPTVRIALLPEQDFLLVRELVETAAARWGLGVEFTTDHRGAILLEFRPPPESNVRGRALVVRGCYRYVWAVPGTHFVAHEIGHALGLTHSPPDAAGRESLMDPSPAADAMPRAGEVAQAHAGAARMARECVRA